MSESSIPPSVLLPSSVFVFIPKTYTTTDMTSPASASKNTMNKRMTLPLAFPLIPMKIPFITPYDCLSSKSSSVQRAGVLSSLLSNQNTWTHLQLLRCLPRCDSDLAYDCPLSPSTKCHYHLKMSAIHFKKDLCCAAWLSFLPPSLLFSVKTQNTRCTWLFVVSKNLPNYRIFFLSSSRGLFSLQF
jgi:hypothetical protein